MKSSTNVTRDKVGMAAQERYEQAMVDADIEGLARSPEIEAKIAEWNAAGIDEVEQIRRLKSLFASGNSKVNAAE